MDYVVLGNTGIKVSRICFGSLTIGPLQSKLPVEQGAAVIRRALELGINFIDTAQLYKTYRYIRKAIADHRGDVVISSKTYAYTREQAVKAVEEARRELDRDVIDIFMLHEQESIHTLNGHAAALDYLCECKSKGIIRAVGASMHHVAAVYGAIEKRLDVIHPLLNMKGLGIVDGGREDMEKAIKKAHESGIGVFSMKPLGGGNLFAQATESLKYCFSLPYVDSVAIGMQSEVEVEANISFYENGCFDKNSLAALSAKKRRLYIEDWCRGCGKCQKACPQGALSVADNRAKCDESKCLLCGYCASACPNFCIKVL